MKRPLWNPWSGMLLAALVVAPAHGGLALLTVLLITAGLTFRFAVRRNPAELRWDWLVAGSLFFYFIYFYGVSAIHGRDFLAPFASMKGNLPLLFLGLSSLLLPRSRTLLSAELVGYWARRAVLLIALVAVVLYAVARLAPHWDQSIIDVAWQGGVGGRLQMYSRNPLMFASAYLALSYLALLGWRALPPAERRMAVVAVLTGLLVIMFWAQGRAAVLVALPVTVLALWYARPRLTSLLLSLLAAAIVLTLAYGLNHNLRFKINAGVDRLWVGLASLPASGAEQDASVSIRLRMYRLGAEAAAASPWWGYGYQNRFEIVRSSMQGMEFGHLHNGYLNHMVAGGLPGLVLFCWLLALPWLLIRRARSVNPCLRYMAMMIVIVMAGTAFSTAVLGHYVNSTFYGLLFLVLSLMLPPQQALSVGHLPGQPSV
jgi:O-antigen ligase